jgi:hypothetical protein
MEEFINQKKEMFRVQLSYNTLKTEITKLDDKKTKRETQLKLSHDHLETDRKDVMKFVDKNNKAKKATEEHEK